jgi:hypothetical protein
VALPHAHSLLGTGGAIPMLLWWMIYLLGVGFQSGFHGGLQGRLEQVVLRFDFVARSRVERI